MSGHGIQHKERSSSHDDTDFSKVFYTPVGLRFYDVLYAAGATLLASIVPSSTIRILILNEASNAKKGAEKKKKKKKKEKEKEKKVEEEDDEREAKEARAEIETR
jgi:flagellar biosynthesis component FlhA